MKQVLKKQRKENYNKKIDIKQYQQEYQRQYRQAKKELRELPFYDNMIDYKIETIVEPIIID